MTNDEMSKSNNLIISNNSNQTQNNIGTDKNYKIEISNIDNKNNDKIEDNKKEEKKYAMIIQSNFLSANSQYIKSINSICSKKSKSINKEVKEMNMQKIIKKF